MTLVLGMANGQPNVILMTLVLGMANCQPTVILMTLGLGMANCQPTVILMTLGLGVASEQPTCLCGGSVGCGPWAHGMALGPGPLRGPSKDREES